jgi:hypothetical protein
MDNPPQIVDPAPMPTWSRDVFTIERKKGPTYFEIRGEGGRLLVKISVQDGAVTFGPDYNPDEAAKAFWSAAIGEEYRKYLRWKEANDVHHPAQ